MDTLKEYMEEQKKSDEDVFNELELNEHDKQVLKVVTLSERVSVPALVNLVLREKDGQIIKEENKEELLLRKYISDKGNITEEGKVYIESTETKNRINGLLNG